MFDFFKRLHMGLSMSFQVPASLSFKKKTGLTAIFSAGSRALPARLRPAGRARKESLSAQGSGCQKGRCRMRCRVCKGGSPKPCVIMIFLRTSIATFAGAHSPIVFSANRVLPRKAAKPDVHAAGAQ